MRLIIEFGQIDLAATIWLWLNFQNSRSTDTKLGLKLIKLKYKDKSITYVEYND